MIKRLAIVGVALVVLGRLNLTGYGNVTSVIGVVVLLGAACAWAVTRHRAPRNTRR
jgi:drug/metabolite transporter (DMT)-like permease